MALTVQIVAPESTLWQGEATSVSVPAADGELGIRPGRQPVLAVLRPGTVHITGAGGAEDVAIEGGFVSVDDDDITIVVDSQDERRTDDDAATDEH